ncbi:hypothetical protein CEXT_645981 [Caerostris extrusa]|uniref:Uncharacterized protein n=1 Tax=Caerostris extrusa TaxID=172846 RepID=A0AAV4MH56_CAEEX|nr:hypothetical protein CEXT_645981 [Caerostris extrusa]
MGTAAECSGCGIIIAPAPPPIPLPLFFIACRGGGIIFIFFRLSGILGRRGLLGPSGQAGGRALQVRIPTLKVGVKHSNLRVERTPLCRTIFLQCETCYFRLFAFQIF